GGFQCLHLSPSPPELRPQATNPSSSTSISDVSTRPPAPPASPICAVPAVGRNRARLLILMSLQSCCAVLCESSTLAARWTWPPVRQSSPTPVNGSATALRERRARNTLPFACLRHRHRAPRPITVWYCLRAFTCRHAAHASRPEFVPFNTNCCPVVLGPD